MLQTLFSGQLKEKTTYMVWCLYSSFVHGFGCLSAISQLASRVGEGGGVRQLCLHSVTQPGPGGESREGGCIPPLGIQLGVQT